MYNSLNVEIKIKCILHDNSKNFIKNCLPYHLKKQSGKQIVEINLKWITSVEFYLILRNQLF